MDNKLIYLDNAATSFPKPESVYEAVTSVMRGSCGNPGRSGHKISLAAGRVIQNARMMCARLFGASLPESIVFTSNTTAAINIGLKGIVKPGDHVITTSLEHNSVSRPLRHLELSGAAVTKLETDLYSGLSGEDIAGAVRPDTKLVVCTHISNVTGTENDIASIGAFCRDNGLMFFVDAAQSAGFRKIDVQSMNIDMLAFPGHKGLFGIQGTGGLYIRPGIELETIIQGGTGSASESLEQPMSMPERFESGTPNTPGLAGLSAGIEFILSTGIEKIATREAMLTSRLIEGIGSIGGIRIIGPGARRAGVSVVSICIDKVAPAQAAVIMDAAFNIAVRSGLHCSSDAHRSIGTLHNGGTVRISPNYFNTVEDIDACLSALEFCVKGV